MKQTLIIPLLAVAASFPVSHAIARTALPDVVEITLQDSSVDPSMSGMMLKTDVTQVKAGRVTLHATNRSKNLVHEVVVAPAPSDVKQLPYNSQKDEVLEKRAHSMGEISDLKPGESGKLTIKLEPGTYVLFCNQPGHYKAGMFSKLVVAK